ncbi:response regulator transcription factor [Hymenobacter wooponensis]|uniref:Response regulator transcription factor n=1 Tax=Hymenobacter wooponensis TaxID=1525360 RepID=A0A4Z0MGZ2_9BACT|nr:response regulator transcription factor [Hymenobacter wooponensis]TGD78485.1 response regulator transcription factor [Hymenobacter wooponensis]
MCAFAKEVLIVASPTLHRQGLLAILRETWPNLTITLQMEAAIVPQLLYQQAYAVVVLDCSLLAEPALGFLKRLRAIRSTQPVLLLTSARLPTDLRQYLADATATCSWLPQHAAPSAVAALFHTFLPDDNREGTDPLACTARLRLPPTPFSRRELEVLRLVVQDYCNQEIADQLFLSVRTVESHRRALLQKAGAKTLVGLAVRAVQQGWVTA